MTESYFTASVHPTALIGEPPEHRDWHDGDDMLEPILCVGARIGAFVTIDAGLRRATRIGWRSWLMKHVHVGHDAWIGDDCELAPGVAIGGHAEIGSRVRIGLNACVKPFVKVGPDARIGMGAVVICDVPAGEVWAGNPARRIVPRPTAALTPAEAEGWEVYAEPRTAWRFV